MTGLKVGFVVPSCVFLRELLLKLPVLIQFIGKDCIFDLQRFSNFVSTNN